jgi:hypothetical protein
MLMLGYDSNIDFEMDDRPLPMSARFLAHIRSTTASRGCSARSRPMTRRCCC